MCVLSFCEGMSNVWNMLFGFYSTTESQIQNGISSTGIVVSGILVGTALATLALLFRKFSYVFTGV